ncbi:hypothetical protein N7E81_09035 [Reichenbachiella carrageenanivorans]|uniref:DUF4369 domain-containing protein n=1 Tax=Reichenbachiella carrageenanivorans TaxID=2979869 RepID=A0ABY6D4Z5_9BACT|nr:hypothetical protein [Reichenbachiella carrageenanivorans]UXX81239.1 hypothetical protein N7E81_09035 [Reichenbachiella carrageenanivorans]
MKTALLSSLFSTLSLLLSAHPDMDIVSGNEKSEYIISNGLMIFGDTDVNLDYDDAILRSGKDITHYPPSQLEKVAVFDEATGNMELYFSGSFGLNNKQYLFKILSEGTSSTLLYREGLQFSSYDESIYPPFFLLVDGQVYSLSTDKKELIKQLSAPYQKELLSYIKDNHLDLTNKPDLIRLFEHYNVLQTE